MLGIQIIDKNLPISKVIVRVKNKLCWKTFIITTQAILYEALSARAMLGSIICRGKYVKNH